MIHTYIVNHSNKQARLDPDAIKELEAAKIIQYRTSSKVTNGFLHIYDVK